MKKMTLPINTNTMPEECRIYFDRRLKEMNTPTFLTDDGYEQYKKDLHFKEEGERLELSKTLPFGFHPWIERHERDVRLKDSKKYLVCLDDGEIIEAFYDDYTDDFSRPAYWIIINEIKVGCRIEKQSYCIKYRVKGWKELDPSN